MRVVVIGTTGQIATELHRAERSAELLLQAPERVDLMVKEDVQRLLNRLRPTLVINAAAYTAVDRAEAEQERAFAINRDGAADLAQWCNRNDSALIHFSTDYVFDGSKPAPYVEADPTNPINVYGASKLAGEVAVRGTLDRHLILRTSWVFSAHGQNFVRSVLRMGAERDELRVVADQFGRPSSARNLARLVWELAARLTTGAELAWGTYHLAGAGSTSWHAFAEAIVEEQSLLKNGKRPRVNAITSAEYPTAAKRPASSVLDTSLFERVFGLQPASWREELRVVVRELASALGQQRQ